MTDVWILAGLVAYPFIGGLLCYLIGIKQEKLRDYAADFVAVTEMLAIVVVAATHKTVMNAYIPEICGMGLRFTMDGFRVLYSLIAGLMWMMTTILSREYFQHHPNRNRFYCFLLMTLGATMGVFLSADLFTTFIFFEIMSFTSYVWVAQEETEKALRAAGTYLTVAVLGGLVMLMGLFMLYHELGTLMIAELREAAAGSNQGVLYASGACLLVGFGAKAGAFPLHIWLPKAHPVAPAPASALLSGILTKTGIFGILIVSSELFLHDADWGMLILVLGVLTMLGGAILAIFSVDLKRTLACSSMSQIGFILVGIGMQGLLGEENALAVHGTLLHMMNHSLIKLVLFMAAGVIYMNAHALNLNKIQGFGRKKPLLKILFLIGALAIAGIPMFSGYISKTLIHESIVEYGGDWLLKAVEILFLLSGGLTLAYMTKLYVAVFVEENSDHVLQAKYDAMKKYMNRESTFALSVSGGLLLIWGLLPHTLMDRAAEMGQGLMHLEHEAHQVAYFSWKNLSGGLISIAIGIVVYLWIVRRGLTQKEGMNRHYKNAWPKWMDLEELIYRPILLSFIPGVCAVVCRIADSFLDIGAVVLRKTLYKDSPLPHELPEGNVLTKMAGQILNGCQRVTNLLHPHREPHKKDYVHILAVKYAELRENNTIIQRSLSFGLLLFAIGLCLTLVYILL